MLLNFFKYNLKHFNIIFHKLLKFEIEKIEHIVLLFYHISSTDIRWQNLNMALTPGQIIR